MGWLDRWRIKRRQLPLVRPWAIACPVLVLLLAAPLIRPLFSPGLLPPRQAMTLETIRSILRDSTLTIDRTRVVDAQSVYYNGQHFFSLDAPAFALGLSGVSRTLEGFGVPIDQNPVLHEYLLILFAITLPTALASGLLYRMGRAFELRRSWRMVLALAGVLGTGWFSYAVVLMPQALSTSMVVLGIASLWHVASSKKPLLAIGWLMPGGLCAGIAAVIDLNAAWVLVLLPIGVLTLVAPWRIRLLGLLLLVGGFASPVALHATINPAITGDLLPASYHQSSFLQNLEPIIIPLGEEIEPIDASIWVSIGRAFNRAIVLLVGSHGIFSHFPVLVIGMTGALMILRRNWGRTVKVVVSGVLLAIIGQIALLMSSRDTPASSFASVELLTLLPILMLFASAWLRRRHSPLTWTIAGVALGISVAITLVGATHPAPADGYTRYTPVEAIQRLIHPSPIR